MLPSKAAGCGGLLHCAGNKAELFAGLRQALVMEGNAVGIESHFCSALEPLPRADRDHMKMRGGGAAALWGLQP